MKHWRTLLAGMLLLTAFGMLAGLLAGAAAHGFTAGVDFLNRLLAVTPAAVRDGATGLPLLIVLAVGGLAVGLIQGRGSSARLLGPVDTIEATHRHGGRIDVVAGLRGTLASFVALASGASAGQYGPLVHFGATLGSLLARVRGMDRSMGTIGVGCGVAAAIAAAFAAPIAGVIFAHEVLLRHYSLRAFAPITVAAVTGHLFGTSLFDSDTLSVLETIPRPPAPAYLALALLGVLSALFATLFMRTVETASNLATRSPLPAWLQPACAGAAMALLASEVPEVLGNGLSPMREALLGEFGPWAAALLLVAKFVATVVCLALGFGGGILSPALLLGTLFGGVFAALLALAAPGLVPPQVFAVGAMAALASAVTGAPLTTILIVFELTRNYELTIAVMVTVVFANLVSYRIYGRSFYDRQLRARGIDFSLGRELVRLQHEPITAHVSRTFLTLAPETSVADAARRMRELRSAEAHLVDHKGRFHGVVGLTDLERRLDTTEAATARIADHTLADHLTLSSLTSVWDAMRALEAFHGESVPVLGPGDQYEGVLYEASVIRAYRDTLAALRREEHAIG